MNQGTFIGNLTADAVRRQSNASGKDYLTFSIACNYRNKETETTQFVSCLMSGETTKVQPYLVKGKKVAVTGRVTCHAYMGRDNAPHAELQVVVRELELCGGSDKAGTAAMPQQQPRKDDLPF